jgi:GNAT superfamily N-acetyltransferase
MRPQDVEAIERATLEAFAPQETAEVSGWLIGLDPGTVGRARSAVPLRHDLSADPGVLDQIEAAYVVRRLAPRFRIADVDGLAAVRESLARRGFAPHEPTLVMTGAAAALRQATAAPAGEVMAAPDAGWIAVFQGEGFDPVDAPVRLALLTRAKGSLFARVQDAGETVAVGVMSFGHGWAGVHGMRTAANRRGEGLAGRVLAGLAEAALARGIDRVFLQVEEPNASARALYDRAGLQIAWRYRYWRRQP